MVWVIKRKGADMYFTDSKSAKCQAAKDGYQFAPIEFAKLYRTKAGAKLGLSAYASFVSQMSSWLDEDGKCDYMNTYYPAIRFGEDKEYFKQLFEVVEKKV